LLGIELSGFLGIDFFSSVSQWGIDYQNRTLHFNNPAFNQRFADQEAIPLYNGPIIKASFGVRELGYTYVDTGSYLCYFYKEPLNEAPFLYPDLPSPSPLGTISFSLHSPCTILTGDLVFSDITVGYAPLQSQLQGVIGNNLLSKYSVLFDWERMDLRLRPHGVPQEIWEHPKPHHRSSLLHLIAPPKASPRYVEVLGRASHSTINYKWTKGARLQLSGIDWQHPEAINHIQQTLLDREVLESEPMFLKKD